MILESKYTGENNLFTGNKAGEYGGAMAHELCLGCAFTPPGVVSTSSKKTRVRHQKSYSKKLLKSMPTGPEIGSAKSVNSTFSANVAGIGGGAYNGVETLDTFINAIFWNNQDDSGVNTPSSA
ncbi:MAG: hypothetical protein AAFR14_13645, partial [Bacteroidota bacterium]